MLLDHALDFPATAYIGSQIKIDSRETVLLEPPSGESRADLALAGALDSKDVEFYPGTGWRLRAYQASAGDAAERQDAQAGIMKTQADGGTLQGSGYLSLFAAYRQRTDTGATYGAGNVPVGDKHYELALPAGKKIVDADLAADRGAYAGPPDDDTSVSHVRLVADTVPDEPGKALHVKLTVADPIVGSHKELGKVYFVGPASQRTTPNGSVQGYGQYCFKAFGDGLGTLYERVSVPKVGDQWFVVDGALRWCPVGAAAGTTHVIEIVTEEFVSPRGDKTGFVLIRSSDTGRSRDANAGSLLRLAGSTGPTGGLAKLYAHCDDPRKWKPSQHAPVRYDHRGDASPHFQLARPRYPTTGYVVLSPFDTCVIPGYPNARFTAYWLGTVPKGCSVSIDLYRPDQDPLTGTPLAPDTTTDLGYGGNKTYTLHSTGDGVDAHRAYTLKLTLNGTGDATPTVAEAGTFKDGSGIVYDVGETTIAHPAAEYQASGQDFETGREATTLTLHDYRGEATQLSARSQMPIRLTVPYPDDGQRDVTATSQRSVVVRGYVASATSTKLARADLGARQGISPDARTYVCQVVGMHQRLDEAVAPIYYSFLLDRNAKAASGQITPALASDVIRELLGWCGFPDEEIGWDVGDPRYPTRLFPTERESGPSAINATSPLGEIAMHLARVMLGRYLAYCPNSSRIAPADGQDPTGMWTMPEPPYAPYRPLARFENAPVAGSGAGIYLAHSPWPDWSYRGRPVPVRPILRGETKRPEAPEFNFLIVSGVKDVGSAKAKLTTVCPNPASFDAIPGVQQAHPNAVDYVGRPRRLIYVDPQLCTPEAVQFVARRLIDYAGTGRVYRPFVAPLVLVKDPDDPYLRRRRPLRPNDAIVVRGRMCVVRSCAPFAHRDGYQLQRIECFELRPDPANPI